MRRQFKLLLLVTVLFVVTGPFQHKVKADLILGLQTTGSTTVNSGDTVNVDLFISDSDSSTALQAEGLQAGGARILKTAGAANATPGTISDIMNYWTGGLFDTNPVSSGGGTEVGKVSTLLDFLAVTGAGAGNTSITIARFAFQISGAAGSTVQLTADRLNLSPQIANTTFGPIAEDLDDGISQFGALTFTVAGAAAVPEPASLVLGAITIAVAGGGNYLRRRKVRNAQSTKT